MFLCGKSVELLGHPQRQETQTDRKPLGADREHHSVTAECCEEQRGLP